MVLFSQFFDITFDFLHDPYLHFYLHIALAFLQMLIPRRCLLGMIDDMITLNFCLRLLCQLHQMRIILSLISLYCDHGLTQSPFLLLL